jgi:hypothetical protein
VQLLEARDEDLKALGWEEIDIARQSLAYYHPLAGARPETILPNLLCCLRWCRSKKGQLGESETYELCENEADDLRAVDRRLDGIIKEGAGKEYTGTDLVEDQRRIKHAEEKHHTLVRSQVGKDPFNTYGYGIIAYFNLQSYLMYAYLLICAMAVFVMYANSTGEAFKGKANYGIAQFSLGNYGYAKAACVNQNVQLHFEQSIACKQQMTLRKRFHGVVPGCRATVPPSPCSA